MKDLEMSGKRVLCILFSVFFQLVCVLLLLSYFSILYAKYLESHANDARPQKGK